MVALHGIYTAALVLALVPCLAPVPPAPEGAIAANPASRLGTPEESAGDGSHPLPRVRVDVERVRGPREAGKMQAKLRSTLWGGIVACYSREAQHNQKLRGDALIRIEVDRAGKVIRTRRLVGDMPSVAVVRCWQRMLRKVQFPEAPRGASADVRIWIAPGDRPVRAPRDRP